MKSNSRLVYSTDQGRIKTSDTPSTAPSGDGIIRIKRETKGRKGKGVTLLHGFLLEAEELKILGKKLKQLCGTGGTIKPANAASEAIIEIQGDHRQILKEHLESQGFRTKQVGG